MKRKYGKRIINTQEKVELIQGKGIDAEFIPTHLINVEAPIIKISGRKYAIHDGKIYDYETRYPVCYNSKYYIEHLKKQKTNGVDRMITNIVNKRGSWQDFKNPKKIITIEDKSKEFKEMFGIDYSDLQDWFLGYLELDIQKLEDYLEQHGYEKEKDTIKHFLENKWGKEAVQLIELLKNKWMYQENG